MTAAPAIATHSPSQLWVVTAASPLNGIGLLVATVVLLVEFFEGRKTMDVELERLDDVVVEKVDNVEGADDKAGEVEEAEIAAEVDEAEEAEEVDEADVEMERPDEETESETEVVASTINALVAASAVNSSLPLDDASVDTALVVGTELSRADGSTTPAF